MQAVRIIAWVALIAAAILFAANNWTPVEVLIWEGIVLETKVPALMLVAFLLGLLPMWLVHYGARWRLRRRIRSLENAQATSYSPPATTTDSINPETP